MKTMASAVLPLAALLLFGFGTPAALAQEECDADLTPELVRKESGDETGGVGTRYTFDVEVNTEADCAIVRFELVARVQRPNGDEETDTRSAMVKLSNGSITQQMLYNLELDNELLEWKFKLVKCEPCVLDAPG